MDNGALKLGGGICCLCVIILSVILILVSFSSLEYTELGLNYSWFGSNVENEGYSSGRYFLGLGHHFIRFPAVVVQIEFSDDVKSDARALRSRTNDGLEVELDITFQYQMNSSSLPELYAKFGTDYQHYIINYATNDLTMRATHYDAKFLITNRTVAAIEMEGNLSGVLDQMAYVELSNFQLQKVSVPKAFGDEITRTENVNQDIQIARAEKDRANITQQTLVAQAQRKAQTIINQAAAQAETTIANAEAYVNQFKLNQNLQAKAMKKIKKQFGDDEKTFLEYLRTRIVRDHPQTKSIISAKAEL